MKEILIRARIDEEQIQSAIQTRGFEDNIEKVMLIIAVLENLKQQKLNELNNLKRNI